MMNAAVPITPANRQGWSAVGSMSMCVALLIASEFMPVSLLTPIATDLHATEGMAGQAISVSGLFAVITSLLVASLAGRMDRRRVLLGLTAVMLVSLRLIATALLNKARAAWSALQRCRIGCGHISAMSRFGTLNKSAI